MQIDATTVMVPNDLSLPERNCLQMLAEGHKLHEMSNHLALSAADVESLLVAAEAKLGARNRFHAVSIALRTGEISY